MFMLHLDSRLLVLMMTCLKSLIEAAGEVGGWCPIHVIRMRAEKVLSHMVLEGRNIARGRSGVEAKLGPFLLRGELVLEG